MAKEMKLEEAMERLARIVALLEDGGTDLETSLGLYEEGVSIIRICNEKLDQAEQKVRLLKLGTDGTAEETPFAEGTEANE